MNLFDKAKNVESTVFLIILNWINYGNSLVPAMSLDQQGK